MKIVVQVIVAAIALNFFSGCAPRTEKDQAAKKPSSLIQNPVDQTDVFAIPLDNSEEEEDAEYKTLQSLETKKKPDEKEAAKKPVRQSDGP